MISRWNLLCFCAVLSNEICIPLELLWFDNQLTVLGGLLVITYLSNVSSKVLTDYIRK